MSFLRRQIVLFVAVSGIGLAFSLQFAIAKKNKRDSAAVQMDEQKRALHALNARAAPSAHPATRFVIATPERCLFL